MEERLRAGESIPRIYFSLALPNVLSMVVTIFYNMADTYFIAQTQNADLVAGVSLCAPVFTLLMAFGNIFGQGGCSLTSRLLGQKNESGVRSVSSFCFYAAALTGAASGAVMLLFRGGILNLLGADANSAGFASAYYTWLALGAPFVVVNFVHSNLLRAIGLPTKAMTGSILGAVVNIILDPILISGFALGAAGAAIATVIGYVCTVVYFLAVILRSCPQFTLRPSGISPAFAGQIFGIGIPAALTNFAQSLSVILLNQALLPYGNDKIAAMGIAMKVSMVAVLVMVALSFGGQPLVGYLYGAGDLARLRELLGFCLRFVCGLSAALSAVLALGAPVFMGLFLKDPSIIQDGTLMLRLQVAGLVFGAGAQVMMIFFQATGKMGAAFFLSISRQGVIFAAVLAVLAPLFHYHGIIATQLMADVLNVGVTALLYRSSLRRELSPN